MPQSQHQWLKQFGLAPELKRCCWYVLVGTFLSCVTAVCVEIWTDGRVRPVTVAVAMAVFVVACLVLQMMIRWRVGISTKGISRRIGFWWDHWSWEEISSGDVRKIGSRSLYSPKRRWLRRVLNLESLSKTDASEVLQAINTFYVLPPPPSVPDELKLGFGLGERIEFYPDHIHYQSYKADKIYTWEDVQDIHIERFDRLRRDFISCTITFPGREIKLFSRLNESRSSTSWNGATAEQISEFLLDCPARDRVHVTVYGEELTHSLYIERRLLAARKQSESAECLGWVAGIGLVAVVLWFWWERGPVAGLMMALLYVVQVVPLCAFVIRDARRKARDWVNQLEKVLAREAYDRPGSFGGSLPESPVE